MPDYELQELLKDVELRLGFLLMDKPERNEGPLIEYELRVLNEEMQAYGKNVPEIQMMIQQKAQECFGWLVEYDKRESPDVQEVAKRLSDKPEAIQQLKEINKLVRINNILKCIETAEKYPDLNIDTSDAKKYIKENGLEAIVNSIKENGLESVANNSLFSPPPKDNGNKEINSVTKQIKNAEQAVKSMPDDRDDKAKNEANKDNPAFE